MRPRSKATLFLAEQLIVITVFALCATACISILVTSYLMAANSRDTSNALIAAQNYAETFKASGGDVEAAAALIGGNDFILEVVCGADSNCSITAYFDDEWQLTEDRPGAAYKLILSSVTSFYPDGVEFYEGDVVVTKIVSDEELVRLPVAVRN